MADPKVYLVDVVRKLDDSWTAACGDVPAIICGFTREEVLNVVRLNLRHRAPYGEKKLRCYSYKETVQHVSTTEE